MPAISAWDSETLAELEAANAVAQEYPILAARRELIPRRVEIADSERVWAGYDLFEGGEDLDWWEIYDAAVTARMEAEPHKLIPADRTLLGGYPAWVQYAEPVALPFFLQLVPPDELMLGDGGHLYIFLDRRFPDRGVEHRLQMY
jgi:hypothetical protein